MSFVKVTIGERDGKQINTNVVVNTAHVLVIDLDSKVIALRNGARYKITPESLDYLLLCVEAQDSLAAKAPPPPSLKTRLAQALRNEFPNGTDMAHLLAHFPLEQSTDIRSALIALETERVVIPTRKAKGIASYAHAANLTRNPDPATEVLD